MFNRVPSHIKEMMVQELERSGGKDWEHFATGLGYDLKDRNKIRIKQGKAKAQDENKKDNTDNSGEVDRLELEHNGDVEQILLAVITKFEDRCIQRRVNVKMLDHIIDLLKKREFFGTPFNKLAKQIEEEKNNFQKLNYFRRLYTYYVITLGRGGAMIMPSGELGLLAPK